MSSQLTTLVGCLVYKRLGNNFNLAVIGVSEFVRQKCKSICKKGYFRLGVLTRFCGIKTRNSEDGFLEDLFLFARPIGQGPCDQRRESCLG